MQSKTQSKKKKAKSVNARDEFEKNTKKSAARRHERKAKKGHESEDVPGRKSRASKGPRRQSRKEQDDFEEKNDKKRRKKRKNDRKIKRSKQSKHSSGASGRKKDSTSNPREKKGSKEAPDEKPDKPIVELDSNNKLRPNSMIVIGDGEFQVDVLIGSGGFGDVYLVKDKDGNKYALKTEYNRAGPASRIKSEVKCYDAIRKAKKADPTSCTRLLDFHGGGSLPNLKFFIMTLVGPSLEDLLISCEISVSTAVRIAIQCFEGIMDLHSVGYVHRDIKLANYVVGLTNRRMIYLVDMGMVCAVLTKDDKMPASSKYEFIGTLLYAPRTSHLGLVQTRKDDLESWIYSCVELFAPNKLPWTRERDRQKVSDMKTEFFKNPGRDPLFQLLPRGFDDIVKKISVMDTLEAPDYKGVRELLDKIAKEEEVDFEEPFEWEQQNQVAEKMKELEKNADKCEKERNLEKNVEKEKNAEKEKNEEKKAEKEMNVEVEKKPDETPKPAGPEGKGEGSPETENVTNLPPIDELAAIEKAEKE